MVTDVNKTLAPIRISVGMMSVKLLASIVGTTPSDVCQRINVVVSDMWDGYVNLAGEKGIFPNGVNVLDRFHFVQHLSTVNASLLARRLPKTSG